MRAMILEAPRQLLRAADIPSPKPDATQVLVKVSACAVCRTDLHVVDAELPNPKLPLVPGHEIVGVIVEKGKGVQRFKIGDRVGIPWLGWTCGECEFCRSDRENLCDRARFTGYTLDGGYAEFAVADGRFCFPIPQNYSDAEAAPLLCAGLIGYRSLVKTGSAKRLGLYGFGAAAHIVAQIARHQGAKFMPSPGGAIRRRRHLPNRWARFGPATPKLCRRKNWTPPSFSHRLARSCHSRYRPLPKVARSSVAVFT
jgi:propanol-preferring alcohol dehydrogenase